MLSNGSRGLLVTTSVLLLVSIFVPIWRIELDAPQYPEGLVLLIYARKLGGHVDIINGLNHYIGMGTLHAENFVEFTLLPYIIGFYSLLMLLAAIRGTRSWLYGAFGAFVVFGIVAMADFWRWEYNYGHNLDPNAAIVVPGMSYQPPLIGFKQLLNFGAYSIPDIGGWLFVVSGLLLLIAIVLEKQIFPRQIGSRHTPVSLMGGMVLAGLCVSCQPSGPEAIRLNADHCTFCQMTISDGRFGVELLTQKGRAYKFDDWHCLQGYLKANDHTQTKEVFIHEYTADNQLISAATAFYVTDDEIKSPMGGHMAAFQHQNEAQKLAHAVHATVQTWNQIMPEL